MIHICMYLCWFYNNYLFWYSILSYGRSNTIERNGEKPNKCYSCMCCHNVFKSLWKDIELCVHILRYIWYIQYIHMRAIITIFIINFTMFGTSKCSKLVRLAVSQIVFCQGLFIGRPITLQIDDMSWVPI